MPPSDGEEKIAHKLKSGIGKDENAHKYWKEPEQSELLPFGEKIQIVDDKSWKTVSGDEKEAESKDANAEGSVKSMLPAEEGHKTLSKVKSLA